MTSTDSNTNFNDSLNSLVLTHFEVAIKKAVLTAASIIASAIFLVALAVYTAASHIAYSRGTF
jgi:hypothetical protein